MGNSNLTYADANRPAATRDTRDGREVKASRKAASDTDDRISARPDTMRDATR